MRRLILRSFQSPGDVLMLTAAVRDLHAAHPGRFQTDVRTSCPALWDHNPHLTRLAEREAGVESLDMHYPLIHDSNQRPYHFLHGYPQFLEQALGVRIPLTQFRGDVHLTDDERSAPRTNGQPPLPERYWILVAGGKYDFTAKWWNPASYQQVVDHFRGRIAFVQCGEAGHWHPPLEGVVNLIGQTTPREFVRLMHHAEGVVCPVTFAMHLAAAVPTKPGRPPQRPCVVIAGGREPAHWEAYPQHQFLSTNGALPCCLDGGCWRSRCQLVGDGDPKDRQNVCERPVQIREDLRIPQCLEMITAADVIRRIELYFEGGAYPADARTNGRPAHRPVAAPPKLPVPIPPERPAPRTLRIECPRRLDAALELSIVLRHLRHYRNGLCVEGAVTEEAGALLEGLCRTVPCVDEPRAASPFAEALRLDREGPLLDLRHSPSTRAARLLVEDLKLSPIEDLCRYQVQVPEAARMAAAGALERLTGRTSEPGRPCPVVLLDLTALDEAIEGSWTSPPIRSLAELAEGQGLRLLVRGGASPEGVATLTAADPFWSQGPTGELLAGLVSQARLVIGGPGATTRLAAAVGTPAIVLWDQTHPVHEFPLAGDIRHLVPENHEQRIAGPAAAAYFRAKYPHVVARDFGEAVLEEVARRLAQGRPVQPVSEAPPPRTRQAPRTDRTERPAPDQAAAPAPLASSPQANGVAALPPVPTDGTMRTRTTVRFIHGLGDCAHFARLIPLYTQRGHAIGVECTPDKRILFEAAGACIVPRAEHVHGWGYPPFPVHAGPGLDHLGSKPGWNLSESPLPNIGGKDALWDEYCRSRVRVTDRIPDDERTFVARWIEDLPRPLVLLHTKGNTGQAAKSLPDPIAARLYGELLDRFDGSLVLLD
ncbi:MAG: hypothetical protein KF847_20710, partial [Pirellulales bacterium]|nr:hypothetical protein [Pirellulales bacterium]